MKRAALLLTVAALIFWTATLLAQARARVPRHSPPRLISPRPAPLIVSVLDPRTGPIRGGTLVTIRGSGYTRNDVQVYFDDQEASSLTYVAADELRVISPPHSNGYVPVRVVSAGRSALAEFLYIPPPLESIATGSITTVAGIGLYLAEGGLARAAPFEPDDVAVEADGTVIVGEGDRFVVRQIAPNGVCTRLAGRGLPIPPTEVNDTPAGDGGPATSAFTGFGVRGVTVGPDGNVYLATLFLHRIRRIDRRSGIITTVAGSGPITYQGAFAGDGGPATEARLDQPNQAAFDADGNMYILDAFNYRIRRVTPGGIITTIAGNGTRGFSGDGGPAMLASFDIGPNGDIGALKVDPAGNLLLADVENRRIRKIDHQTGIITTIAGGGTRTDEGALATESRVLASGIAIAGDGTTYFSDASRIRKILPQGTMITLFGETTNGFSEDGVRAGRLTGVGRMEIDEPRNRLLFCEFGTRRVRSIDLATSTLSTIAGIGPRAFGENGPAIAAELEANMQQIAVTADDGLLMGGYTRLRKLERDGILRTIAGGGLPPFGPPPPQRPAASNPIDTIGIAVATNEDIYVTGPFEVGRITSDGMYHRVAGGAYGYSGDNGPASAATFDNPAGIAIDAAGNLFVADTWNHCIRRIDARSGIITTFAGKVPPHPPNVFVNNTSSGDGGRAVDAQMNNPQFIAVDAVGNIYVSDTDRVRMIDGNGIIDTVLFQQEHCAGPLASDRTGRVFVHCFNGRIMRIDGKNNATVVGRMSSNFGFSGDGGPASEAMARAITGMAIDRLGNVFLTDQQNRRIRAIRGIAN